MTVTTEMEMDVQVLASWSTAILAQVVMLIIEISALKLVGMASILGFFLVMMETPWMKMGAALLAKQKKVGRAQVVASTKETSAQRFAVMV
jgi:hypothetical protein